MFSICFGTDPCKWIYKSRCPEIRSCELEKQIFKKGRDILIMAVQKWCQYFFSLSPTSISSALSDLILASVGHLQMMMKVNLNLTKLQPNGSTHYGSIVLHQFCERWGHLSVRNLSSSIFSPSLPCEICTCHSIMARGKRWHLARSDFVWGHFRKVKF